MERAKKIMYCTLLITLSIFLFSESAHAVSREKTLIIAQGFDPTSLWPNASSASNNLNCSTAIVEPLFREDPKTGKNLPVLAEKWFPINDTTWQVKLRKGVSFSNGEPMNADAVMFSFNLYIDKKLAPSFNRTARHLKQIEKVDDYTVNIHTKAPYAAMEATLVGLHIVPPQHWKDVGGKAGFGKKPIGTGPFKFSEWKKDESLIMDKNEKYWGKLPKGVDRVIWKPVPDDSARAAGLETGEFDLIANMSVNSVQRIEANSDLKLISIPSARLYFMYLSILEKHPSPLHKKKVREALNYAVDKESIIKHLFFGKAKVLQAQLLRERDFGFNPNVKPFPYDPEKAKKLLSEAGYPNGFTLDFKFPVGRYAQDKEVCEAVGGMLAKVGVKCNMIQLESGKFLQALRSRDLGPMYFIGYPVGQDPHYMFASFSHHSSFSVYQHPEANKLVDAGIKEMDNNKRKAMYEKISKIFYDDAALLYLYQGVDFYGINKRVKNWMPTGNQRIYLYDISLKD